MTPRQKEIIIKLLQGYSIYNAGTSGFRLRDPQANVVMKISAPTLDILRKYLRKHKGVYVINKSIVRQQHGNTFLKSSYKQLRKGTVPEIKKKDQPKLEKARILASVPGAAELPFDQQPAPPPVRTCRVCGCTESDACYHPKGGSCWWVEADLCSHCHHWPGEGVRYSTLINGMTYSL